MPCSEHRASGGSLALSPACPYLSRSCANLTESYTNCQGRTSCQNCGVPFNPDVGVTCEIGAGLRAGGVKHCFSRHEYPDLLHLIAGARRVDSPDLRFTSLHVDAVEVRPKFKTPHFYLASIASSRCAGREHGRDVALRPERSRTCPGMARLLGRLS